MNVTKVPEDAPSQRAASEILDRKTLDRLIEHGNDREKQRLRRLDCKHANSWITSLPSATEVATPSWTRKSIPQLLHALSTIILSRVPFASNLWMCWAIML